MVGKAASRARLRAGGDSDKEGALLCLTRIAAALRARARCA